MFGMGNRSIKPEVARQLFEQGASVVDVRSPAEYAAEHLESALNVPLGTLAEKVNQLPSGTLLLHCKSGIRSAKAVKLLKKFGMQDVHNLGSFAEARKVVEG